MTVLTISGENREPLVGNSRGKRYTIRPKTGGFPTGRRAPGARLRLRRTALRMGAEQVKEMCHMLYISLLPNDSFTVGGNTVIQLDRLSGERVHLTM